MKREEVSALMASSNTADEWNANADRVKTAFAIGGKPQYPKFWWPDIIQSGLADKTFEKWNGFPGIRLVGANGVEIARVKSRQ